MAESDILSVVAFQNRSSKAKSLMTSGSEISQI